MNKKALLVMAKRPFPGQTKTRMTPALSPEEAADLYACFLQDVLALARAVPGVTLFIAFSPATEEARVYFAEIAPDFGLIPQLGDDLGARLDGVLTHCLNNGYTQVVAMNSDSPSLPAAYLAQAFAQLDDPTVEVVLGPCEDGGYYAIGWKRPFPRLVRAVQMSTNHVLQDTLAIAQEENLHVALLPTWYDVDELAELRRLQKELQENPTIAPHTHQFFEIKEWRLETDSNHSPLATCHLPLATMKTAVIIPALNEAGNIAELVQQTLAQAVDWVIVVDNGSTDETAVLAAKAGAKVIAEPRRGYGYACAAGTAVALQHNAEILVYMDGDFSSLPQEMTRLVTPIQEGETDLVLGSRTLGHIAAGAMPPHQRFGNWLSSRLMSWLYHIRVTDLGPYRAIRASTLRQIPMQEMTFGWPTEMMVKVVKRNGRIREVPVSWHSRRSGKSKVSGTLRGSILAAYYILGVTLKYSLPSLKNRRARDKNKLSL